MKTFSKLVAAAVLTFSVSAQAALALGQQPLVEYRADGKTADVYLYAVDIGTYSGFYDGSDFAGAHYVQYKALLLEESYRNHYVTFDSHSLSSIGFNVSNLTSVSLMAESSGGYSSEDVLQYTIFDVVTDPYELMRTNVDRQDIFEDLQSGQEYAKIDMFSFPELANIYIPFNQLGVDAFVASNISQIGIFAIGGSITNYTETADARLWGDAVTPMLHLTFNIPSVSPVPEANTYAMMVAGLAFVGFRLRRQKQK